MADIIRCVEHQALPVVKDRRAGDIALTHKHVELLAALKTLPTKAFTWGHNSIKWTQFCGLVQLGDLTVEVLPKLYGREFDVGSSRNALVKMLRKAGLLKVHKIGGANISTQKHTLLDIFIIDFCDQLNVQLVQGKLRQYIALEENLPLVRGKLLVNYQMRHNLAHKERLFCQYDELSEDILINQIIKYTLTLLLPKCRSDKARKAVIQLLYSFDSISNIQTTSDDLAFLVVDRITARYGRVIEFCRMFMQGLAPDLHAGKQEAFALMFDMNVLFENWVASLLKPVAHKHHLTLKEQGPRKYLAYRADLDKPVFQMKPDISLLDTTGRPVLIADAKWKLLAPNEAKLGVSQADLYQMQAYANRYQVQNLMLVYPQQAGLKIAYDIQLQGVHNINLKLMTLDITADAIADNPLALISEQVNLM
jgi:5-methylcytosine-specific restriction enzyme subunit McrC